VLYVINPFTYSRLMAGQYLVLAGYALMPWFVAALLRFVRRPERGTALRLGMWVVAIGFVSLHFLGFAVLVGLIALAIAAFGSRDKLKKILGWGSVAAVGVVVINSFWLVPALMGKGSQAALISGFDTRHLLSFRTASDVTFGQLFNTLGLYGFWGDREGLYRLPKSVDGLWWLVLVIILVVAGVGAWKHWRRYRLELVLMLGILAAGWVLAQGIMDSPFAGFDAFLYAHVPFFRGYREPGKFVGLMALPLAYGFGLGAAWLIEHTRRWPVAYFVPGLLIAIPIFYTPTMLWGAAGQLRAVDYPADWYTLGRTLDAGPKGDKVLFLPWHQYMYFDFAGRLIANPASRFFDRPTIQGDNAEIGLIERQSSNPTSEFIESQILAPGRQDMAAKLRSLGIKHVVLAKAADYTDYGWLESQPGIKLDSDSATLRVFEVVR
jgi:hypothetical protein